jgi:hypothetical protein
MADDVLDILEGRVLRHGRWITNSSEEKPEWMREEK